MKNLAFAALALILTLNSCKKDRVEQNQLRRPISVSTKSPIINQKMELKYEDSGVLKEIQYFNNNKLISKVVYQNQAGLPLNAVIYGSLPGETPNQVVAEVKFSYNDQRLLKVALQPKVKFLFNPANYEPNYKGGEEDLNNVFILGMINGNLLGGSINSLSIDPATGMERVIDAPAYLNATYEFDTQKNPFYGLPLIGAVVGNNAMASLPTPMFVFDGVSYFHENNAILRKMDIGMGLIVNLKTEYTYDSQGYPTRFKTFGSDGTSEYSETVIKY